MCRNIKLKNGEELALKICNKNWILCKHFCRPFSCTVYQHSRTQETEISSTVKSVET